MPYINGFRVTEDRAALGIKTYTVPGTSVKLPVRSDVAPLLIGFAREFHEKVERLDAGCCWGYAYRAVRGARSPSFHAAGIAIDLNAPKHPLGKRGTFNAKQVAVIRALCRKYGLRWGGDYKKRADEMHFEVIEPISKALARVRALQAKPAAPSKAGDPVLRQGAAGQSVANVQNALRKAGHNVTVDGQFGPGTTRSLKSFQAKHGLPVDGIVNAQDWAALRKVVHG